MFYPVKALVLTKKMFFLLAQFCTSSMLVTDRKGGSVRVRVRVIKGLIGPG